MKSKFPDYKTIKSSENGKYKSWQKLLTRKYREREGCFLVEGDLLIKDALLSGADLREIVFNEGAIESYERIKDFLSDEVQSYELAGALFDNLRSTENGRDIIGVFKIPIRDMASWSCGDVVVLDRLQDPGNVGTIIRTSDAAGVAGIISMKGTVDSFSPKVVRAAAGSLFRVPIVEAKDENDLKKLLGELGAVPMSIDPRGGISYYEMPPVERAAIIVGNEGGGICKELLDLSETKLTIPMRDGIESLNAAMALGITIYERVRRKCKRD